MRIVKALSVVSVLTIALGMTAGQAFAQAPPAAAPAAPVAGTPAPPPPPPKVLPPQKQDVGKAVEGAAVPDVKLPYAFENKMASLKEIAAAKGPQATILSFANTACSACIGEIKLLQEISTKHPNKLQIVVVVTDRSADRVSKVLGVDDKMLYLIDPYFTAPPVFGFKSTPGLAIIQDGKVVALVGGFVPTDEGRKELAAQIEAVIK